MRTHLQVNSTPQSGSNNVGPMPNLRAAIRANPIPVPGNVTVTANSTSSVTLTWTASAGIAGGGYEIFRRDTHTGAWVSNATTPVGTLTFTDSKSSAGKAYVYTVRAKDGSGWYSADSNYDVATTTFADSVLTPAATLVKAKHIIEADGSKLPLHLCGRTLHHGAFLRRSLNGRSHRADSGRSGCTRQ